MALIDNNRTGDDELVARQGCLVARPYLHVLNTIPLPGDSQPPIGPGLHPLKLHSGRSAMLYVPSGYASGRPLSFAVMLHGAGGDTSSGLQLLLPQADDNDILLLAPASNGPTWDVIHHGFGPDVTMIDHALAETFSRFPVDPAHIAIGGFSDGASYALSLGLTNGHLFSHIIAFSPGFMAPAARVGQPAIFISHGTADEVLSIDRCSRRIVPQLTHMGYKVHYHEFTGGHTVPAEIASEAAHWFTGQM